MQHFEEQAALLQTANSQGNFTSFQEEITIHHPELPAVLGHPCQAQQSSLWWLRGAKYQSLAKQYLVIKVANTVLFWLQGFLRTMLVLQGAVQEAHLHLTQEENSTGRALREAAKPLAHLVQKAGALGVCKAPVRIPPEISQVCWPNNTSHSNSLPILTWHCLHFMVIIQHLISWSCVRLPANDCHIPHQPLRDGQGFFNL